MATIKDLLSNMISKIHTKMDAPTVTEEDNGKVLGVVDGTVGLVEQGGSLPSGGTPYQQLVTDGEGKWVAGEQLAWKDESYNEVVPYANVAFSLQNGLYAGTSDALSAYEFENGKKVKVVFDGEVFEQSVRMGYLGNLSLIGEGEDTGEDWLFTDFSHVGLGKLMLTTRSGDSHEVGISDFSETVHPIPDEYLNGATHFHVNVTYDADTSSYIADRTYDEIKEAEAQKKAIVGTLTDEEGKVYTIIGCDVVPVALCYLVAFDLSEYEHLRFYVISVQENGIVYVDKFKIAATAI